MKKKIQAKDLLSLLNISLFENREIYVIKPVLGKNKKRVLLTRGSRCKASGYLTNNGIILVREDIKGFGHLYFDSLDEMNEHIIVL